MVRLGFGLKAVGLFALALGAIVFMVSTTHAEKGAAWMVGSSNINATLKPKLNAVAENETVSLLTKIMKDTVKILCKTIEITNSLGAEGAINEGKAKFTGCVVYTDGGPRENAVCLPKTAGVEDVIETNTIVGLLVLVGGVGEALIKPATGGTLATFETNEECLIGEKISITGELLLKDSAGQIKVELVTHLVEADNTAGTLQANGQTATIDGSVNLSLSGLHIGLKWNGLPA